MHKKVLELSGSLSEIFASRSQKGEPLKTHTHQMPKSDENDFQTVY